MIEADDVIVAIATPPGRGAVGIVRISGNNALDVFKKIFKPCTDWESHRMYYGRIYSGNESNSETTSEYIDEVMACCMLAPRSYTREDTVEIYAHGGIATLQGVLNAVINNGARLALPGEFTKRAFLNGRINLTQAEAVMDLINANTNTAKKAGLKQLGGGLSRRISIARDKLLMWLANIELSIDYPEHEEEAMNRDIILQEGRQWIEDISNLLKTAEYGRIVREGIKTAIIGRPNVGKSTLINAMLGEDRAIVHEIPGTTRDVLSEQVKLGEVVLQVMDTAGIRETDDPVESIGINKTHEAAQEAELIIYVIDQSMPPIDEDIKELQKYINKNVIVILNKNDMPTAIGWDMYIEKIISGMDHTNIKVIAISAQNREGLTKLYNEIQESNLKGLLNQSDDESDIITRQRHVDLLGKAIRCVKNAISELEMGITEDLVSINFREAYTALGEVLGLEVSDDIVERIFSEFCVGK